MTPFDPSNIRQALMAYADGELDAEQSAAVLEFLIAHPHWLATMRDDQRLLAAARRVMRERTPTVPDSVRDRVAALAAETASTSEPVRQVDASPSVRAPRRPSWRPVSAAAAIALIIGTLAGGLLRPHGPSSTASNDRLPPELMLAVTRVHVNCSRFPFVNHNGPFPTTGPADRLADDVRRAFHANTPHPDLSTVGFEFVGAGPCQQPLDGTVHLLYRASDTARRETLSVFVQADYGQIDLPPREMRLLTAAGAPHPSYAWRSEGAVFYLVTDGKEVAEKARDVLQLAMAQ